MIGHEPARRPSTVASRSAHARAGRVRVQRSASVCRLPTRGDRAMLTGRKLAVSFHVVGATGPMTWHAKALDDVVSHRAAIRQPRCGSSNDDGVSVYDDVVVLPRRRRRDGAGRHRGRRLLRRFDHRRHASTLNGDDRWPDVLSRRLHAALRRRVASSTPASAATRSSDPPAYSTATPFAGGPSALATARSRRARASLVSPPSSGWKASTIFAPVRSRRRSSPGSRRASRRVRAHGRHPRRSARRSPPASARPRRPARPRTTRERKAINTSSAPAASSTSVADFDAATRDPQTGGLTRRVSPNSTIGGAGDRLHPNRAGYQAMGNAVDIATLARDCKNAASSWLLAPSSWPHGTNCPQHLDIDGYVVLERTACADGSWTAAGSHSRSSSRRGGSRRGRRRVPAGGARAPARQPGGQGRGVPAAPSSCPRCVACVRHVLGASAS